MHTQLYAYSITSVILVERVYPCDLRIHTFTARVNSVEIWSIDPSMDDLGVFARDLGYKPQGKSAPMKSSSGSDRFTTTSASLFSDDQFSDVFGGPPKYSSSSNNNTASPMSDFDYDSIFKSSATNEPKNKSNSASAVPVYDKPIYDEDIFDGLPGLKSKSVSASAKHEENVFASMSSSSPPRKPSGGNQFDDLLGNLGRREKVEPKKKEDKSARDFDDLLPGFSSSSPINRPSSEPSQTPKPTGNSNQTSKVMMDDPFVVLESSSTPGVSSPGFYNDPLEEISKLSKSGNTKPDGSSVSGGVFDDIDPLSDFGKSVPAYSSGMNNRRKDGSPSSTGSSTRKTQDSAGNEALGRSSFNYYSESHSQKKVPVDDYQESHQTIFDMPTVSKDSQKLFGQRASSPSYVNANFNETNSQGDMSPRSEEHLHTSDDVWLTVSEIPLFTQPTKAPPPSRPPPPIPRHTFKSERAFSASNARNKNNNEFSSSPNSAKYSQSPKPFHPAAKDPEISSIDDLENFAMARNRNNVNENTDVQSPSENIDTNSTAAASAAAMKEAMDRAEAKFRHAKEVREREHAKAARNKESMQLERDEQETWEEELRENQERMNRERQQREREEEEREQRRIERERARQAVERATREARERAAAEAREKAAADARLKNERAAVQRAQAEARERAAAEARERAERAAAEARERANVEAREKEAREKAAVARAEADARRRAERAAVDRVAAAARERAAAEARERAAATAAARANQQKNDDDLESFFNMGSRPSSAPRPRASTSDPTVDVQFPSRGGPDGARRASQSGVPSNMKKASSTTNIVDDLSSIFGVASASSAGDFQDVEGETEERRRARLERHQRTQERAAKALAEKNQRDLQTLRDQEERHRIAETLDIEIKRWAAGKEGNLRALLSTMQYVLWPECGWQPVSLTDLITGASVKKVYRKATLCIHPDKVQQKGANLQQKYIAEKVFDLLKEAWNKFNSEELF